MPILFEKTSRDSLFYGQWQYAVACDLTLAGCLRNHKFEHDQVLEHITMRKLWDEQWRLRTWNQNFVADRTTRFTVEDELNILTAAEYFRSLKNDFKLVVTRDRIWLYANKISVIKGLTKLAGIDNPRYTEAVVDRPKNSIRIKNSPYELRSYFRWKFLNDTEKDSLRQFLATQQDYVRVSPGLKRYLSGKNYLFLQEYYFIDYTGEQWLLMLSLVHPGMLRKTVTIVKD